MNSDEPVRLTALVRGRVQGVGYRMFAVDQARAQGLAGFARNLPDGRTVEVIAEGSRMALARLVEALRRGPPAAHVQDVELSWGPAHGNIGSFGVRH